MSYKDVDNFYSAAYHAGVILESENIATHDADNTSSYDGWLITLDTMAEEQQHKNIAIYEVANVQSFSQKEANWPREDITIHITVRASGYLNAYTRAQILCRALDSEGYRSIFNIWDDQLSSFSGWQVKYEYGGLWRQEGPEGMERDEKWRPRFHIAYTCNRRIKQVEA